MYSCTIEFRLTSFFPPIAKYYKFKVNWVYDSQGHEGSGKDRKPICLVRGASPQSLRSREWSLKSTLPMLMFSCYKSCQYLSFQLWQVSNLHELGSPVLVPYRFYLVGLQEGTRYGLGQPGDRWHQLLSRVAAVVHQCLRPHTAMLLLGLKQHKRKAESRGSQLGARHRDQLVLNQGQLDGILSQAVLQHVHVASLGVAAKEMNRQRLKQAELERLQDFHLHLLDGVLGVGLVGDVDKVRAGGSIHLLHLRSEEHRSHADKLQLRSGDR